MEPALGDTAPQERLRAAAVLESAGALAGQAEQVGATRFVAATSTR